MCISVHMCVCVHVSVLGGWRSREEKGRKSSAETRRSMAGLAEGMRKCWLPSLKEAWKEKCENLVGSNKQAL